MKILNKNSMIDLKNRDEKKEKIYHPAKKCSVCGMPYVENHMLSESLIKILGDKIRYIPSCKCHETFYENKLNELSKENQLYYWCITILMVSLPIAYIIIASFMVAKLYYKWKLKIPLENLKNGMYHISQQDLDFQIQYTSDDELGQLCDTFEHMKNEIYKSNSKMWNMLQERKALTASVSHDLRTPITVLNGYLDYLEKSIERETLTNETLQTTIKNMTEAVDRLKRYVECVKDIQKMEDIEIKKDNYNLKELIADITKEFSILAARENKKLVIRDFSNSDFISTDKAMLSKVLENIFDNALRFSHEEIIFSIKEKEDYLYFSMQDDGVGFTSEELKSAASFFFSSASNGGNFGIGLSICKILSEKFGGNIFLDNLPDTANMILNILWDRNEEMCTAELIGGNFSEI